MQILFIWLLVSFSLDYVATNILNKIHSCSEFISPYSTANNAINVKGLLCAVTKINLKVGDFFIRVPQNYCAHISSSYILTIT